jgi:hypothetical protein
MKIYKKLLEDFEVKWRRPLAYDIEDLPNFQVGVHSSFKSVNILEKKFAFISAEGLVFSTAKYYLIIVVAH